MENVIKRDGSTVPFNKNKIVIAIEKAMGDTDRGVDSYLSNKIADEIAAKQQDTSVEEIQDMVESKLMTSRRKDVAKAYISYRHMHGVARDQYKELMDAVAEKLGGKNIANQNANIDEASFGGRIGEMSRLVAKRYALDYCMSEMARKNHENNEIYIHDLDSYAVGMHNCLSIPFDDLLAKGFNTRQTDVRPARSINTAFQLVAVIFQVQSLQQFGGVSATHLDWTMVPYVRMSFYKHYVDGMKFCSFGYVVPESHYLDKFKEVCNSNMSIDDEYYKEFQPAYDYACEMTKKELYQAVEGMYHNLK